MTSTVPGPPAPAPLRRSVDDLTDPELDQAIRDAWPYADPDAGGPAQRKYARDIYDAIATRLQVDGPVREDHVYRGEPGRNSDVTLGGLPGLPWLPIMFGTVAGSLSFATRPYEPAKLAVGSVVVAGGKVYVLSADDDDFPWAAFEEGDRHWVKHDDVPTNGALLVDGAKLGTAR